MPASSIDLFHMQDAKNNFNAMRPAPIYSDPTNELMGHCQNIHISRNCYYGYHDAKTSENIYDGTDSEMKEIQPELGPSQKNPKKRCADSCAYPQSKRQREAIFVSRCKQPIQYPLTTVVDAEVTKGMVPTTATHNPSLLRPTHNNPDISRCLMVHMI